MTEKEKHITTIQIEISLESNILDEMRLKRVMRDLTEREVEEERRALSRIANLKEVIEYIENC